MRPACFAETMLQNVVGGFKEKNADFQTGSSQRIEFLFEVRKKATFTNVDHKSSASNALVVVVSNQAAERRQHGDRKIVYTEISEILKRIGSGGHSRTAQAGNDYDIGDGHCPSYFVLGTWLIRKVPSTKYKEHLLRFDQPIVAVVAF